MTDLQATLLGTDTRHSAGYFHDHDALTGQYLVMCFHTPFCYMTGGEMHTAPASYALINSPAQHLRHGPVAEDTAGFCNDWVFLKGEDCEEILRECGLPLDRAFPVEDSHVLTPYLRTVIFERLEKRPLYRQRISCALQEMLIALSRSQRDGERPAAGAPPLILRQLRDSLYAAPEKSHSLAEMARLAGYSVSRFCYLYREHFGMTPAADLLRMRIQKAKELLTFDDLPISRVAQECGFGSDNHFSYAFRRATGLSPKDYRKRRG